MLIKILALSLQCKSNTDEMKYNELHRALKKIGCYELGKQIAGHPAWYSPITGITFTTSNHLSEEVKPGTLRAIKRQSGLK